MSIPGPTVEAFLGGSWIDISESVELSDPLSITRGRANDQGSPDAGTCEFDLVNDDGRFTIGNTGWSPQWKKWTQVRITQSGSRRYTGYVSSSVETWPEDPENSQLARVHVTCTDTIGMAAMSPVVKSWVKPLISSLNPTYYWPLDDAAGATVAGAAAGGMPLVATVKQGTNALGYPLSSVLRFGVAVAAPLDADAQVSFSVLSDDTSARLTSTSTMSGLGSSSTVMVIYTPPESGTPLGWTSIFTLIAPTFLAPWVSVGVSPAGVVNFLTNSGIYPTALTVEPGVPVLLSVIFQPGSVTLLNTGDSVSTATVAANCALYVGIVNPTGSPAEFRAAGLMCHLAVLPGAMSPATFSSIQSKVFGVGYDNASTWLSRALSSAGISASVTALGGNPLTGRPQMTGSNPADVGNTLANSCGAMVVADRFGTPTWIDPAYCPARVDIDASMLDLNSLQRTADQSLYYTQVTIDGTVRADVGGFPISARDIPGLLPEPAETSYVTYLANTADVAGDPRITGITFDLATLDTTTRTKALGLDLRSRIYLPTPPLPQVPQPMVMTVEGYTEKIGAHEWTLSVNTAPDPSLVWEDDITVWQSDYRAGC